jgi:hypothetical protein
MRQYVTKSNDLLLRSRLPLVPHPKVPRLYQIHQWDSSIGLQLEICVIRPPKLGIVLSKGSQR